jgi:hypothetical protein
VRSENLGHLDEISDGLRSHLSHGLSSMHLHRGFREPSLWAEVDPDPTGGCIGRGYYRCCSLGSGAGSASRRMGARRQRTGRARRHHRRIA